MTPEERSERHWQARQVIDQLDAIAATHGLRSGYWMITGPADPDVPPVPRINW
ncbi:MAG TPA: hypothetical protein VF796_10035 [Humisphaera sp.]